MTKTLVALPCTARELENALHAVCDHDGLWDAKVWAYLYDNRCELKIEARAKTKGE